MTVRELKEILCEYDEDTLIFCNGVNTDCSVEKHGTVLLIQMMKIFIYMGRYWCYTLTHIVSCI